MSIYKELSYDQDIDTITGIQFSVMSAEEIRNRSVAEITLTDTYAGNEAIFGGLFDPRMGVLEQNKRCTTCHQKNNFCPGHFGHIELAKPLFYIQFFDTIKKILKCVCYKCSKLLLDKELPELKNIINKKISRQKKFDAIYKICSKNKIKRCGKECDNSGCGARQPDKIVKDTQTGRIILEWNKEKEESLLLTYYAEDVLKIFTRITNEDSNILGFPHTINRPENLICTVFPVPPPSVRPCVRNDTGQRCQDDLSHKLCDIVKTNNTLKQKIEKGVGPNKELADYNKQIEWWTLLLQFHLSTFIDNKIPGIPPAKQRNGRPLRSLTERLKQKEGRIRGNLMGKRVDFSARSVITPDPCISINDLGVPLKIAMNLTYPEKINDYNREKLIKLVKNGPNKYPGAKYLRKANDNMRTIRLEGIDFNKLTFENGDIVDRHMMDGDFVLFNRQPSLHKMSMMSHKVRVMKYDTFRLNPAVTPSYNADYDGDEMNMHLPQSIQTENELEMLSNVTSQIISPRQSKPIISVVQDVTLGLFRITKDDVYVNEKQLFNLLMSNTKFVGDIPQQMIGKKKDKIKKWQGKQLLSEIIPKNINLKLGNNQYDDDDVNNKNYVIIENGEIKQGIFDKKIYQSRTNGLVHSVFNDNGSNEARYLFDNTQRLICNWLVYSGFSVGISDLIISNKINTDMKEIIYNMKTKVYDIIKDIHLGKYQNDSFDTNKQDFEKKVNKLLNDARDKVGKIALKNITDENRMINMIKSGSKGNSLNIAQMVSTLGQQNVDGQRIVDSYNDRTLPHYTKYDDGPESKGFVENSFIAGLTPQEFYFHAMGGREGLIDTAVKTSKTGYIQRRLVKSMEDCKINYDLTVRNATGAIVQFLYGEDGMNAIKLENQKLNFIKNNYGDSLTISDLEKMFLLRIDDCVSNLFKSTIFKKLHKDTEWEKRCFEHFKDILQEREYVITKIFNNTDNNQLLYPISIKRIISTAINIFHKKKTLVDLEPNYILDHIDKLCNDLYLNDNNKGNKLFQILIKTNLSPKIIITIHKLNKLSFEYVVNQIRVKFMESIAHPSEMVGVVAAQSIGEPCTQLTLNTFHSAGIGSGSHTIGGVPRIEELLDVSKNIKGPTTKVYIDEQYNKDYNNKCNEIKNSLETTYIKDIIVSSTIYYDPDDLMTTIDDDKEFIEIYKKFEENCDSPKTYPWLLRFVFNKEKMYHLGITMDKIYYIINKYFENIIDCYYSDDNANKLIFRIKLIEDEKNKFDKSDIISELKALEQNIIENIILKGVSGISKVKLEKDNSRKYKSDKNDLYKKYDIYEGNFVKSSEPEYYLLTNGNNLKEILQHPDIDKKRTISNDITEVNDVFGIEAARQVLFNEIDNELSGVGVDFRHLSLLVDTMTNRGTLLSINRHGINRSDIGPFAKCSFEETSDMLIKAGLFGEYDKINGVSANVILGQIAPCGTGDSKILIDEEKLLNINDIEDVIEDDIIDDDMCDENALSFDFEMPIMM